jgi:hypothetical protein
MSDEHTVTGEMRPSDVERLAVERFAESMLAKLRLNAHKAHWSTVDLFYLMDRVVQEMDELREALYRLHGADGDEELGKAVVAECADVANFAMMIADSVCPVVDQAACAVNREKGMKINIHTIPLNDAEMHIASRDCPCWPLIDDEDEHVIIHHAWDGREVVERMVGNIDPSKGWVLVGEKL